MEGSVRRGLTVSAVYIFIHMVYISLYLEASHLKLLVHFFLSNIPVFWHPK